MPRRLRCFTKWRSGATGGGWSSGRTNFLRDMNQAPDGFLAIRGAHSPSIPNKPAHSASAQACRSSTASLPPPRHFHSVDQGFPEIRVVQAAHLVLEGKEQPAGLRVLDVMETELLVHVLFHDTAAARQFGIGGVVVGKIHGHVIAMCDDTAVWPLHEAKAGSRANLYPCRGGAFDGLDFGRAPEHLLVERRDAGSRSGLDPEFHVSNRLREPVGQHAHRVYAQGMTPRRSGQESLPLPNA